MATYYYHLSQSYLILQLAARCRSQSYNNKDKLWEPATVVNHDGNKIVNVETTDGSLKRRRIEQTKPKITEMQESPKKLIEDNIDNCDNSADTDHDNTHKCAVNDEVLVLQNLNQKEIFINLFGSVLTIKI